MLINLCYCLTNGESEFIPDLRGISKHLMLLFNCVSDRNLWKHKKISKHLMLLFNWISPMVHVAGVVFQNISCYCLTEKKSLELSLVNKFQNISCYCLTRTTTAKRIARNNFKTSHVTV